MHTELRGFVTPVFLMCIVVASGVQGAACASPAQSPLVTPTVDVDVHYRASLPDGSWAGQRMRWSSATWRQRVDPDNSDTFMLTDYHTNKLLVVDLAHKTRTEINAPGGPLSPPGTAASGDYTRLEDARVADEACVWWRTKDTDGQTDEFCYTADGILLAARNGQRTLIEAVVLKREQQDTAVFAVPSDLKIRDAAHP